MVQREEVKGQVLYTHVVGKGKVGDIVRRGAGWWELEEWTLQMLKGGGGKRETYILWWNHLDDDVNCKPCNCKE